MDECPGNHAALPSLFDRTMPDNPVLWAVLRGRNAGRALVDDLDSPSQCLLRTDAVLTFASRQVSQAFLDDALDRFGRKDEVWLIWPPELSSRLRPPETAAIVERFEFTDCDPQSQTLADLRSRLPPGFAIRPIGRQLLERCAWREEMEFYAGSLDNFLANGVGLCLLRGDEIVSEAYASSLGEGNAETGAITHAAHRGRGYAPIACAYLYEGLARRGYQAYWSCDADNPPSIRVAEKLGFRTQKAYQILEYSSLS